MASSSYDITIQVLVSCFLVVALFATMALGQGTQVGFYESSCPQAESIVNSIVSSNVQSGPKVAARLLRMHFHDCFVRGCDASVLLDGEGTEKSSKFSATLAGFEVIDEIKSQLEEQCPGVVSCADIIALAARDSVKLTHGPSYEVRTGRRDGNVSIKEEADKLPGFGDTVDVQKQKFAVKGLDTHDLVTLLGAHTIGVAACSSFTNRLFNFNKTGRPDPSMDPSLAHQLQSFCPLGHDQGKSFALDVDSELEFDLSFYYNLQNSRGVLQSDERLWTDDDSTRSVVEGFLGVEGALKEDFNEEFVKAMVKMGEIEVLTGSEGEIRKVCSAVNQ